MSGGDLNDTGSPSEAALFHIASWSSVRSVTNMEKDMLWLLCFGGL